MVVKGLPPGESFSAAIFRYNRGEIVRHLHWGGDPNQEGYRGTLLHYAVRENDAEMVRLAIRLGADVNRKSGWAGTTAHVLWTPRSFAKHLRNREIEEILRQHGGKEEAYSWK